MSLESFGAQSGQDASIGRAPGAGLYDLGPTAPARGRAETKIAPKARFSRHTLYQVVQQHLESFLALVEAQTGASLPQFVKEEFDAFLECGILAHGFLRLR